MNHSSRLSMWFLLVLLLGACRTTAAPPQAPAPEPQLLAVSGSLGRRVPNSAGDAAQLGGVTRTGNRTLELGRAGPVGVRFTGVDLPAGATVTSAYLEFTAASSQSGTAALTVRGLKLRDAPSFSAATPISQLPKTLAQVVVRPSAWVRGQTYRTTNLGPVVAEVVSSSGWSAGRAVALVLSGTGVRNALAYDADPRRAPRLVVSYTLPAPAPDAEIALWQARLESAFTRPPAFYDPKARAASGDLFHLGRYLNHAVTSLSGAYRVNRDPDTVAYLKEIMDLAYAELDDPDGDGYLNWIYESGEGSVAACIVKTAPDSALCGTDRHEMEEMLAHAMAASAAYTLKQGGYDVSAWVSYFKNHFEAKWRKRSGVARGFPFLSKSLAHPYAQFVRYHLYMYLLTSERAYYDEALRLAQNVRTHLGSDALGNATWAHRIAEGTRVVGCQPGVYTRTTVQALTDLEAIRPGLYGDALLTRVARTMRTVVMAASPDGTVVYDNCGQNPYSNYFPVAHYPYAAAAPWDPTGETVLKQRRAYDLAVQRGETTVNAPAMMIVALGSKR